MTSALLTVGLPAALALIMFGLGLSLTLDARRHSTANAYSTNVRLRWEYQPGSELFVVLTEGRNTLGPGYPGLESRGFVVKLTRLFRL